MLNRATNTDTPFLAVSLSSEFVGNESTNDVLQFSCKRYILGNNRKVTGKKS